jgi:hypothetical protein
MSLNIKGFFFILALNVNGLKLSGKECSVEKSGYKNSCVEDAKDNITGGKIRSGRDFWARFRCEEQTCFD